MPSANAEDLFERLKESRRLPSPPGTALRVLELCRRSDTDVKQIADAIMADPALSGRLLRYANSAALGSARTVTSIRDAVLQLGLRSVKLTALGFSLATSSAATCDAFSLKRFWTESIVSAILARRLAAHVGCDREEAFTAGLLARIGHLALACGLPDEYGRALRRVRDDHVALVDAERESFGTDHIAFGVRLLRQWALPDRLAQAIEFQADPAAAPGPAQALATAVEAAVQLAPGFLASNGLTSEGLHAARTLVATRLRLDAAAWQALAAQALTDYGQFAEIFDIELDSTAVFELYGEAQEQATRVGIVAELESSRVLEENRALLKRATTDALTGIANRARFDERAAELVAAARRGHGHFALLLFDIDNFKQFNDAHGHAVGDLVLRGVAHAVATILREVDLVARYGGEEFAILAPNTDLRGACTIAARTRRRIEDLRVRAGDRTLHVTISLGLALSADFPTPPTAAQMVAEADAQLYLSKKHGRNTWSYRGRCAALVSPCGDPAAPMIRA